ncbi:MAG TPA: GvpL/GvpF family gas vesicle protein [Candidatus Angelobacter sp.]|nr:GvpL/GvpF family gas vesicle protein [Candidatus Angelobacter sp.]
MARFLYCVMLPDANPAPAPTGVAEQPVLPHDSHGLRVYWSEVTSPEALAEGASRKAAEGKYRQVLRELVARQTPIAFPFPALVADEAALDALLVEQHDFYAEALQRLVGMVQYELTATWEEEDRADLATPVSGREYQKRREKADARVAALDIKLKTVTAGVVRQWRAQQDRRKHRWYALVRSADRDRLAEALRQAGPSEGVRLRLSGPWPPSEFVVPHAES